MSSAMPKLRRSVSVKAPACRARAHKGLASSFLQSMMAMRTDMSTMEEHPEHDRAITVCLCATVQRPLCGPAQVMQILPSCSTMHRLGLGYCHSCLFPSRAKQQTSKSGALTVITVTRAGRDGNVMQNCRQGRFEQTFMSMLLSVIDFQTEVGTKLINSVSSHLAT